MQMNQYRVYYAGFPQHARLVAATSAREAAMSFFARTPLRNSVIVESGILREEVFSWRDFSADVPELVSAKLPMARPRYPRESARRDPIVHLYRLLWFVFGLTMIVAAVFFIADDENRIAGFFIIPPGIVAIIVALRARSRTLRRMLTREPSSLDVR
jgi:hypothetical protein